MKNIVTILLLFFILFLGVKSSVMAGGNENILKLQNSTRIKLSNVDNISSEKNLLGQEINLQTVEDIKVDSKTIIPAGTIAIGNITVLDKKGLCSKAGKLNIETLYIETKDGTRIPLRGFYSTQGPSKMGKMTWLSILISPLFLLMGGNPAEIPAGTKMNAYTDQDYFVKPENIKSL